jgi:GxxExxY protein
MGKKIIDDLVYPELSYTIVGVAYEVFNHFSYNQPEKVYQKAMVVGLQKKGLKAIPESNADLYYLGELIHKGRMDILVEDQVLVELKRGVRFSKAQFDQVNRYLSAKNIKLGILINFTPEGVIFRRLVNLKSNV